jgi:hypothetical protein
LKNLRALLLAKYYLTGILKFIGPDRTVCKMVVRSVCLAALGVGNTSFDPGVVSINIGNKLYAGFTQYFAGVGGTNP